MAHKLAPIKKEAGKTYGFAASTGTKVGLEMWRIEKMDVVALDKADFGKFHTGDCYIALNTWEGKDGRRNMDVHFWLGTKSTQDEQGCAAYKTVEIDTKLGGKPVQYREVQEHESKLFLSYFPKGVQYMEGGIESSFRHVDPTKFDARLFHLKGKRNVRVAQVERKASCLNHGDVFILDLGLTLYQWNGKDANKYEKFKALELITKIKNDERGGKAKLVFLEGDQKDDAFWKALGGTIADVKSAEAAGSDDDVKAEAPVQLFRVSDASGTLKVDKVAEGKLERKMLDPKDVFIVDAGGELFVWVGGEATKQEREKSMVHAQEYLTQNKRPAWVPITRIIATGETPPFKSLFTRWEEPKKVSFDKKGGDSKAAPAKADADTSALYKRQQHVAEKMVDNATGKTTVWRIKNLKKEEVPAAEYGQFFAGDSYIILYAYKKGTKDAWIIYFWQGRDSSSDEKAASALLTVDLDDALGGDPVQVRVTQGSEPPHFCLLFKGKMVIHDGGYQSGFNNRKADEVKADPVSLYHIKGTNEVNTHAIQTTATAASLNSGDCFALNTPDAVYTWLGKGANESERKCAGSIAKIVGGPRKVISADEGKEPEEFWSALGGKGEYPTSKELEGGNVEPRLFHCTTAKTGSFKIDEIFNYTQEDLINDDVIILDAYSEVFVWVGHDSTKEERDNAFKAALEYVKNIKDGRSPNTPVFKVMAGGEPPNFTCHFHGWDDKKASQFEDPYLKALNAMGKPAAGGAADAKSPTSAASSAAAAAGGGKFQVKLSPQMQKVAGAKPAVTQVTAADIGFADWKGSKATADEVRANKVTNMDSSQKELYVNDSEFKTIFKMDKDSWLKLPAWKRKQQKETARLF